MDKLNMNSSDIYHGKYWSKNMVDLHYQATKQWLLNINMTSKGADTKTRENPVDLAQEGNLPEQICEPAQSRRHCDGAKPTNRPQDVTLTILLKETFEVN
jgi:hypothetical protein